MPWAPANLLLQHLPSCPARRQVEGFAKIDATVVSWEVVSAFLDILIALDNDPPNLDDIFEALALRGYPQMEAWLNRVKDRLVFPLALQMAFLSHPTHRVWHTPNFWRSCMFFPYVPTLENMGARLEPDELEKCSFMFEMMGGANKDAVLLSWHHARTVGRATSHARLLAADTAEVSLIGNSRRL